MNKGRTETTQTGLILNFSPVLAEKIYTPEDSAKNGVITTRHRVQIRQTISTTYPAARGNELFKVEEFGLGNGQSYNEQRVTWLNVPKTATIVDIQKRLDEMDSPKLVRTLSLSPVLSEDQVRTIENGVNPKSYEDYLKDSILDRDGKEVLFRGQKQYRKITFSKSWAEDEDNRAFEYNQRSLLRPSNRILK